MVEDLSGKKKHVRRIMIEKQNLYRVDYSSNVKSICVIALHMNYPHKFQIYYILIFYAKLKLNVMLFLVLRMNVEMMPLIHHLEYVMSYVLICDMYGDINEKQ